MEPAWYYVVNGAQSKPVSWDELKQLAAAGKLSPNDLVWKDGLPDWVAAGTVSGLFSTPSFTSQQPTPTTYSVSPPPPPAREEPVRKKKSKALSFDEGSDEAEKPRRERDPNAPAEMPEWVKLAQLFVRRVFNPDPSRVAPLPEEEAELTRAGVMDTTTRKFAVWRRAVLFAAALPCAFAALFGLIDTLAMSEDERKPFSAFGLLLLYLQSLALFALPVAAVFGALAYARLATSAKWVLIGGLVSYGAPLAVAFVPSDWLLDTSSEAERIGFGMLLGFTFYISLTPAILSLLPAVSRACVRLKLMLPESLVPGWGLVTSAPLCVLLTLATFVLLYHMIGNALLLIGLLLWIGAPLYYLTKFKLLTRPVTSPSDRESLANASLVVVGLIAGGMFFLLIFLFTAQFGSKTLMGFTESKTVFRPWTLQLHKTWIEYVGRSLFLTVFFVDLLLRVAVSVWKEDRAFAASAEAAGFERTMSGLGSAFVPRELTKED